MRVYDYEYEEPEYEGYISDERKQELILYLKSNYYKKDKTIPLHLILKKTEDDNEYNFMYNWLKENNITIKGMNGTLTRNIFNYEEIVKKAKYETDLIPVEKQSEYFEKIYNGDKSARKEFIAGNLRLAKWVANSPGINKLNIPVDEKVSYAYEGLIKAVDRFDARKTYIDKDGEERHYRFSTYAVKCIYSTIIKEFYENNKNSLVNVPIYFLEQLDTFADIENLFLEKGMKPSVEDIANIMGIKKERVEALKKYKHMYDFESLEATEEVLTADSVVDKVRDSEKIQETIGGYVLDGVYYEPGRDNVGGLEFRQVVDENTDFMGMVNTGLLSSSFDEILKTLTIREAKFLKERFGLEDRNPKSLEEVGNIFEVTKERVRQIEAKALRKLRHPSRSKKIRDFLGCEFAFRYSSNGLSAIIRERKQNMAQKEDIISENDLNLLDHTNNLNDLDSNDIFVDEFENPISDFSEIENVENQIAQEENRQEIVDGDFAEEIEDGGFAEEIEDSGFAEEIEDSDFAEEIEDGGFAEEIEDSDFAEEEMALEEKLALAIHNLENVYLELDENIKINKQKSEKLRKKLSELNLSTLSLEEKIKKVDEILNSCSIDELNNIAEIQNLLERKKIFEEELKRKKEEENQVSTDLQNTETKNNTLKEEQEEIMKKIEDTIQEI
ncbi:MAG: hypothetical protein J6J60_07915 [Clostridia bacterium]|nr:hypothetical protein [Clostridia bacterium]